MVPKCRTAASDPWPPKGEKLAAWLTGPARLTGDALAIASGLAEKLTAMGVPLHRLRIAMRVDNPLLTAWGILWSPETDAELFTISQALRDSTTYFGSPSQHVMETGTWFRQRLNELKPLDHTVLHELASAGFTDYVAMPVIFGNGIVQPAMFATRHGSGFAESQVVLIKELAVPLSAALEAVAMQRSTASLLTTFLGKEPAARVQAGAIHRGDVVETEAAILLTDMRGFTHLSLTLPPSQLLATLDRYFEAVVDAVRMALSPLGPEMPRMQTGTGLAHLLAGSYDLASLWGGRALRELPSFALAAGIVAASEALAGRVSEAERAARSLGQLDPSLCVSNLRDWVQLRRPEDLDLFADELRRSGLPE